MPVTSYLKTIPVKEEKVCLRFLFLSWQGTSRLLCGWEPSILGGSETISKPFQKKWLPLLGDSLLLSSHLLPWRFNLLASTAGLAIGFYKISWQAHLYNLESLGTESF